MKKFRRKLNEIELENNRQSLIQYMFPRYREYLKLTKQPKNMQTLREFAETIGQRITHDMMKEIIERA